jgi:hypothetical protein
MDGKVQFEREAATDEFDDALYLQAFYERTDSSRQTHTAPARHSPQRSSGPRLDGTRAMPAAP